MYNIIYCTEYNYNYIIIIIIIQLYYNILELYANAYVIDNIVCREAI